MTGAGVEARTHLLVADVLGWHDVAVYDHRASNIDDLAAWASSTSPSVRIRGVASPADAAEGAACVITGIPIGARGGEVPIESVRDDALVLPIDYSTSVGAELAELRRAARERRSRPARRGGRARPLRGLACARRLRRALARRGCAVASRGTRRDREPRGRRARRRLRHGRSSTGPSRIASACCCRSSAPASTAGQERSSTRARGRREHRIAAGGERLGERARLVAAGVAERDQRVPAQVARVALPGRTDGRGARAGRLRELEPVLQRAPRRPDRARAPRASPRGRRSTGTRPGRCRSRRRDPRARRRARPGSGRLAGSCVEMQARASSTPGSISAPVGQASRQRVQLPQPGGTSSSAGLEREIGDDRAERDERAVAGHDRHGVLRREGESRADRGLAVDMVVRVDEHASRVRRARREPRGERLEPQAQGAYGIVPGVARHAAHEAGGPFGRRSPERHRDGDDRARSAHEPLGMARARRVREREAQVAEEPARAALLDRGLALGVRLGARDADLQSVELLERREIHRRRIGMVIRAAGCLL